MHEQHCQRECQKEHRDRDVAELYASLRNGDSEAGQGERQMSTSDRRQGESRASDEEHERPGGHHHVAGRGRGSSRVTAPPVGGDVTQEQDRAWRALASPRPTGNTQTVSLATATKAAMRYAA